MTETEKMLRMINGQKRLIGSLARSLKYYSGADINDDYHDAAILMRKARNSRKRAKVLLGRYRPYLPGGKFHNC